jgi:hypothetical protein
MSAGAARPLLTALRLGDPPERWRALGFTVEDAVVPLGAIELRLGAPAGGISGWALSGIDASDAIDGLPTEVGGPPAASSPAPEHPNGALGLDHVVVTTPDFERTAAALDAAGLALRRTVTAPGGIRQGFRRLGPGILELVSSASVPPGPARFWGLVVIVADLDALAERLGADLGAPKDAVQPGRRIATLRPSAGLGEAVAFISPEP